jgi:hypothetical protein
VKRLALAAFLTGAVLVACSKREAAIAQKSARVGESLKLDDSTWTVIDVKDVGKKVEPNTAFAEPKETAGRFVLVRYKVTNTQKKAESVLEPPKLVDDKSRETERMTSEALYVPPKTQTLGIEMLEPNVEREYATIFEATPDAKGLKLQIRGLGLLGEKRLVELGL